MKQFYIDPKMLFGGIVYKGEGQEIVHLSLRKGNTVPDYTWDHEVTLFVIDGKVELSTGEESRILKERELAVIDPKITHNMVALEDSQVLAVKVRNG